MYEVCLLQSSEMILLYLMTLFELHKLQSIELENDWILNCMGAAMYDSNSYPGTSFYWLS
jgi:hypothetical protein